MDAGGAPELLEAPPCSSVAADNCIGELEPVVVVVGPTGGWNWGGDG